MPFKPGERVGPYEVIGVLGEGGMGKVYLVRNVLLPERQAAMKVVTGANRERFLREIKVLASLDHPNIVRIYDPWMEGDRMLMLMEYVRGESVEQMLRRGPIAPDKAIGIACQVLDALDAAHAQRVVHRDIKPANIMVTLEGKVKLLDFGIARMEGLQNVTRTGQVHGSINYMSPEQVDNRPLDSRTDLYSLGATLYQMVTGRLPFERETLTDMMIAILRTSPELPERLNPLVPAGLSNAIQKAMAKPVTDRYQSAAEMRSSLAAMVYSATVTHVPPRPPQTQPLARPGKRWWPMVVGLILLIGVAAAVFWPREKALVASPRLNSKDGQRYVWIPAGTFRMGCSPGDDQCDDNEKPAHDVKITKGFWMGQTEVTVAAWKRFAEATGRALPSEEDALPMTEVSWNDSIGFCEWANGRLPTEAEWEYAARAGSTSRNYGEMDRIAWYWFNSGRVTHFVAQKIPNAWGLHDMLGNVAEWTTDRYGVYWSNPWWLGALKDPQGSAQGQAVIFRGGSWFSMPNPPTHSLRGFGNPEERAVNIGCRCIWNPPA